MITFDKSKSKNKNSGFTLVEVLIAVVILAVFCVPLLRSIATSFQTNQKARVLMKSTVAAENIMEEFKNVEVKKLVDTYSVEGNTIIESSKSAQIQTTAGTTGTADFPFYQFIITNPDDMKENLPDGYCALVTLDASVFPNRNSYNVSDFGKVSSGDSAIYTMPQCNKGCIADGGIATTCSGDFDEEAYQYFVDKSKLKDGIGKGIEYYRTNVYRLIDVKIDKSGTLTTATGEKVDHVRVTLKIYYVSDDGTVNESDSVYTAKKALYFDNASSTVPLESIYLFINPRYVVGTDVTKDIINVRNDENVDCNLYVVAQNESHFYNSYHTQYESARSLQVNIQEDYTFSSDAKGHITFRTNMCTQAPAVKKISEDGQLNLTLRYCTLGALDADDDNPVALLNGAKSHCLTEEQSKVALHASSVDGKVLHAEDAAERIYKMKVQVFNGALNADGTVPAGVAEVVNMDGTKLE